MILALKERQGDDSVESKAWREGGVVAVVD